MVLSGSMASPSDGELVVEHGLASLPGFDVREEFAVGRGAERGVNEVVGGK